MLGGSDAIAESDSITMYSDTSSILYGTDPHYILSEAQDCFN